MTERNIFAGTAHEVVQAHTIYGSVHINAPVLAVPQQLPHGVVKIVGREHELTMLDHGVDSRSRIVVVNGTAGVGKTALCLHWARSAASRFPDGQLYVDLRGFDPSHPPLPAGDAIRGFLDGFDVPPERIPLRVDSQASLFRSIVAARRVLVVLDNARDADQVRSLLPGGLRSAVVVTSRTELTGLVVREGVEQIKLGLLEDADARQVIASRLDGISSDNDAVGKLASECAGLPLALSIVAGRVAQRRSFPLSILAEELRSTMRRLDALDTGDPYTTARTVFSWSYEALPIAAKRLFRLLGLTTGADIALPAVASLAGLPPARTRNVLAELVRMNLLDEYVPGRYRFHDLLREYATERLGEEPMAERTATTTRLIESYLHTAVAVDAVLNPHRLRIEVPPPLPGVTAVQVASYRDALDWCVKEHQLAVGAVELAVHAGLDRHAWQLAWALVTYLRRFSHHQDRHTILHHALAAARRLGDRYAEAKVCRVLGKTLVRQGKQAAAEDFHVRAVFLFSKLGERAEEADALLGRAKLRWRQNRVSEAAADARRALFLAEAAESTNLRATALNAIGHYAMAIGNPEETITCCRMALALYREIHNDEGAADVLRVLGSAYHHLGKWEYAVTYYEESLALDIELRDCYHTALVLSQIGLTHQAAGRTEAATSAWRRSLELLEYLDDEESEEIRAQLSTVESQ
ncbi:ATP-binding protein [Amycolatopsis anabasis]|uniref:ATP-binding protein n=1 Tax=Amycolatopsis anabasis TaxID=1840409 RepID=UPI00131C5125|nr:tetratricopeptide repeat protein [Amycolatopsis anabasis]